MNEYCKALNRKCRARCVSERVDIERIPTIPVVHLAHLLLLLHPAHLLLKRHHGHHHHLVTIFLSWWIIINVFRLRGFIPLKLSTSNWKISSIIIFLYHYYYYFYLLCRIFFTIGKFLLNSLLMETYLTINEILMPVSFSIEIDLVWFSKLSRGGFGYHRWIKWLQK